MTKAKKSKKAKRVRASFDATSEAVIERRANDEAKQVQEIENELRTEIEEEVREQIENERGEEHSRLVAHRVAPILRERLSTEMAVRLAARRSRSR